VRASLADQTEALSRDAAAHTSKTLGLADVTAALQVSIEDLVNEAANSIARVPKSMTSSDWSDLRLAEEMAALQVSIFDHVSIHNSVSSKQSVSMPILLSLGHACTV
jgi:hypothetical protein